MLVWFQKRRLLSVLLIFVWATPILLTNVSLTGAFQATPNTEQAPSALVQVKVEQSVWQATSFVASSKCHRCPAGYADSSLQCNGQMLAAQVTVSQGDLRHAQLHAIPKEWDAIARVFAPDPPPPRYG